MLMHKHCSYEQTEPWSVERARKSKLFRPPVRDPTPVTSSLWTDLHAPFKVLDTFLLFLTRYQPHIPAWAIPSRSREWRDAQWLTQATRLDMLCELRNDSGNRYTVVPNKM